MSKIIKHKWIPQDGFKIHKCSHCGCIRKWDNEWKRVIYLTDAIHFRLFAPDCKRIFLGDKVEK